MKSNHDEKAFLESVIHTYVTSESPQDRAIKTLAVRTFRQYMQSGGQALELGCLDGFMTAQIAPLCDTLTVLDGSSSFIAMAKERAPANVEFVHTLFEDYRTGKRYDYIFAAYVLEHVNDAAVLLKQCRSLLGENGILFIVVPNARALSRQLARHMGLLQDLYALTPNDINHGHRRVYDRVTLNRDIHAAGLQTVSEGGLMLKPLADFQMDKMFEAGIIGEAQVEGLYQLGLEYPDLAASLFSVCKAG